jgi:diacylglycerol kinase
MGKCIPSRRTLVGRHCPLRCLTKEGKEKGKIIKTAKLFPVDAEGFNMKETLKKISLTKRLKSFQYALNGLRILIREEPNARIHLAVALLVVLMGFVLKISPEEWIAVILCIGGVTGLELINSAIENLSDFVSPEKHAMIKRIKDLSAAAVLAGAIAAAITGLIIFVPKIMEHG